MYLTTGQVETIALIVITNGEDVVIESRDLVRDPDAYPHRVIVESQGDPRKVWAVDAAGDAVVLRA